MSERPHRGDIWYIYNDGLSTGHEIQKTRPAIIVSNDIINSCTATVEVVYLTSQDKRAIPLAVQTTVAYKDGYAIANQISTVDRSRLLEKIGQLPREELEKLDKSLALSVGCNTTGSQTKELMKTIQKLQFEREELASRVRWLQKREQQARSQEQFYRERYQELQDSCIAAVI